MRRIIVPSSSLFDPELHLPYRKESGDMKRIVIWMLSVMMCVIAFAGCADNSNRSQEESLTESSVEESQTAESSVTEESQ